MTRTTVKALSNIGADKFLQKLDSLIEKNPYLNRLTFPTEVQKPPKNAEKILWKKPEKKSHPIFKDYAYFMDVDGNSFPKDPYRDELLASVRAVLTDAALKTGSHHSTWRGNGRDFKEHFISTIEEMHSTLANCQGHWKAIELAHDHYFTWAKSFWRTAVDAQPQCTCQGSLSRKRKTEDNDNISLDGAPSAKHVKTESSTFSQIQVSFPIRFPGPGIQYSTYLFVFAEPQDHEHF